MSRETLDTLLAGNAFEHQPKATDLPVYHVPFDDDERSGAESGVITAAEREERIGLRGPIGAGKTSLLRFALDDPEGQIAPIWVSVGYDGDDVITDPRLFASHLTQGIMRDARQAGLVSDGDRDEILKAAAERRPLPGKQKKAGGRLGAKFWVVDAGLSAEITSILEGVDLKVPADQLIENVNRALEAIRASGKTPAIVIDDSDSFTRSTESDDLREARVGAFFGPVLRALGEVEAGFIVAIHDVYSEMDSYNSATEKYGFLARDIELPDVLSGQLKKILARRIEVVADARMEEAFSDDAVEALIEFNRGPAARNLRRVLTVVNSALVAASDRDTGLIEAQDVERAKVELSGSRW